MDAELLEGAKAQRCSARYLPPRGKKLHRHENAGNAPPECSRNIEPYEWIGTFSIVSLLCGPPIAECAELSQTTHENAQKIRLSSARFQFQTLLVEPRFLQNMRVVRYLFEFFQIVFGKNLVG